MKHGTNIYITKTVHKKKPNKQTNKHIPTTFTQKQLFCLRRMKYKTTHYYVQGKHFYGNQDTNMTNKTNTNNK